MSLNKIERRERIKMRIRKIVSGTPSQPRMTVYRSNKQIYVQFIDDLAGVTLATASSLDKEVAEAAAGKNKCEVAALVGKLAAERAVAKGIKGGRTFSFSAIVVVGNEDGVVGYGLGKASEVQSAIAKGVEDAKKNLVKIPVINGTIPHKQESRYSGSLVMIRPAAPGTGVIAGGAMRAVLESVGIKNVLAKSKGSSNPHNLVKATIGALCELRDAHSIARLRGISMDKVFNG